jgi:hypothetical protein
MVEETHINLELKEIRALAKKVFLANTCSPEMAEVLSDVIMLCERDGPCQPRTIFNV